jgi:hypothetical protein
MSSKKVAANAKGAASRPKRPAKNSKPAMPRKLPLINMFSGHARALVEAANAGSDTHGTGNIAESGGPFEKRLLKLFRDALPSFVDVASGYFMDKDWTLSSQVDFMLCDSNERLQLPPSPDLQQHYVPFTSLHILGQLKNSATKSNIQSALSQVAQNLKHVAEMRELHKGDRINGRYREQPLSVVVFGKGGSAKEVEDVLKDTEGPKPTYVLLIEKGIIFARPRPHFSEPAIPFDAYRFNGDLVECYFPNAKADQAGHALLWVFFALLAKINWDYGNNAAFGPMVHKVADDFPLLPVKAPSSILVQY